MVDTSTMIKTGIALVGGTFILFVMYLIGPLIFKPITEWAMGTSWVPALAWGAMLVPLVPTIYNGILLLIWFAMIIVAAFVVMRAEVYGYGQY